MLVDEFLRAEHRIASHFKSKLGTAPKVYRVLSTWLILVVSKFVMLEAVDLVFGDRVEFLGPFHGLVAFVCVIIALILAEVLIGKIYRALDDKEDI